MFYFDDDDDDDPEPMTDPEAALSYICDACGEEIVVPVDLTAGAEQDYFEDCPVCCRPHRILVHIDPDGEARLTAIREGD